MTLSLSARPALVDAASPDAARQVVEASGLAPEAFRFAHIANRPAPAEGARAVGFHYFRFGIGGGEKVTRALMEVLRGQGRHVVLYVDELVDPQEELSLPEGVARKVVPAEPYERAAFWMAEVAAEGLCCVVYGTWLSPRAPLDCLAVQAGGAAFVFEAHGTATYLFDFPGSHHAWPSLLKCAWAADMLVCLSESDRVFWETFNQNVRAVVNPLDVCATDIEPSGDGRYDVVFCGRLHHHEKRPDEALRAFAAARGRVPGIRMAFVGDGEAREELEKLAAELGCADAVDILGFRDDPRAIVAQAGVLVLTSPSEGFCLVIAEAAALGTPCVVYENPHLATLCGNGGALQVPQGDWEAAGAAIAELLTDQNAYERAAAAGRNFYDNVLCVDQARLWEGVVADATAAAARPHVSPDPSSDPVRALVFNAVEAARRETVRCRDFEDRMNAEWRRANKAEAELRDVLVSLSFRLGRILTWLPRKLRGQR